MFMNVYRAVALMLKFCLIGLPLLILVGYFFSARFLGLVIFSSVSLGLISKLVVLSVILLIVFAIMHVIKKATRPNEQ
jgi:hypothetical protein